MDISMDIHGKFVDMDIDINGKFHIHGKPGVAFCTAIHMYCKSVNTWMICYKMWFLTKY